jgi:hypothetical protein
MVTFLKETEPAFCINSAVSTPLKTQSENRTSSITAPGKLTIHNTLGLDALRTFSKTTLRTTGLCGPFAPVSYRGALIRVRISGTEAQPALERVA